MSLEQPAMSQNNFTPRDDMPETDYGSGPTGVAAADIVTLLKRQDFYQRNWHATLTVMANTLQEIRGELKALRELAEKS